MKETEWRALTKEPVLCLRAILLGSYFVSGTDTRKHIAFLPIMGDKCTFQTSLSLCNTWRHRSQCFPPHCFPEESCINYWMNWTHYPLIKTQCEQCVFDMKWTTYQEPLLNRTDKNLNLKRPWTKSPLLWAQSWYPVSHGWAVEWGLQWSEMVSFLSALWVGSSRLREQGNGTRGQAYRKQQWDSYGWNPHFNSFTMPLKVMLWHSGGYKIGTPAIMILRRTLERWKTHSYFKRRRCQQQQSSWGDEAPTICLQVPQAEAGIAIKPTSPRLFPNAVHTSCSSPYGIYTNSLGPTHLKFISINWDTDGP